MWWWLLGVLGSAAAAYGGFKWLTTSPSLQLVAVRGAGWAIDKVFSRSGLVSVEAVLEAPGGHVSSVAISRPRQDSSWTIEDLVRINLPPDVSQFKVVSARL